MRGVSGVKSATRGLDAEQEHRSTVLLIDERECGASTDRVLAPSSLSSIPVVSRSSCETLATKRKEQRRFGSVGTGLPRHATGYGAEAAHVAQ
jgi:hypothetical protein